jgi:hypothetical protein
VTVCCGLKKYATLYDVNLNPKPAYTTLQQDLTLAAHGAPHRTGSAIRHE